MKKNTWIGKRKWVALTFVILMTGTLCACGNKKMQEIINNGDQAQEENEVTLKEKLQVPEEVEYQFDTGTTFTAEVVIPDCTSAGVYEVETLDFTTNYMDDFCKYIFDDGKNNILWPTYIYTKEETQERLLKLQSEVLEWDLNDDIYQSNFLWHDYCDLALRVQFWQEEWEQYVVSDPGNDLVIYPSPVSDNLEIGDIVLLTSNGYPYFDLNPDYVIAEGTINDRNARISFIKAGDILCDIKVNIEHDLRDYGYYSTYTKEYVQTLQIKGAFVYTEEEAISLANGYLEAVGMAGYQPVNIDYLVYVSDQSGHLPVSPTGYRITFGLCKNDVSMLYDAENRGMITVDIGAEGLLEMNFRMPYMIVSNLTDDTELLTFEKISDVAKSYMSEQGPEIYQSVNRIDFGYIVENYEDGQTLIPVWRYRDPYGTPAFAINAIDGSMINSIQPWSISKGYY